MVNQHLPLSNPLSLIAQAEQSGFERLDPVTRTVVLMALLGLVLLGITLIACVMIGGRWVRRLAQHSPPIRSSGRFSRFGPFRTAREVVDTTSCDTLAAVQNTDETRTD